MKKSKGLMRGFSRGMRKSHRERGRPAVTKYLQEFDIGETVHIDVVSSEPNGMPNPRYQGRTGVVFAKQGRAYVVSVNDGNALKKLIVHPVHLRRSG